MKVERLAAGKLMGILAGGGLACLALGLGGCASPDSQYDRLSAQTSRPGWVVGDPLGMKLSAEKSELAAYSGSEPSDSAVASSDSDQ